MILGHHREALDRRIVRRSLRHSPRLQHALHLQSEVVMETGCLMLLNDEDRQFALLRFPARRLRRVAEVAHLAVLLQKLIGHSLRRFPLSPRPPPPPPSPL